MQTNGRTDEQTSKSSVEARRQLCSSSAAVKRGLKPWKVVITNFVAGCSMAAMVGLAVVRARRLTFVCEQGSHLDPRI